MKRYLLIVFLSVTFSNTLKAESFLSDMNRYIDIGPSVLNQQSFESSHTKPWGGSIGLGFQGQSLFGSVNYGMALDFHYLQSDVLYSNVENKLTHQAIDVALTVDIGLTDKFTLAGAYGISSQEQEFRDVSDPSTQAALNNIFEPVDGTTSFYSIGLKYLFGDSSLDKSSFLLFEYITYNKFESNMTSIRYGFVFGD